MAGIALRMPAALSRVFTKYPYLRYMASPGFSSNIPPMTGLPVLSLTPCATAPHATPYRPALKAGPTTTTSGSNAVIIVTTSPFACSRCSVK